MSLDQENPSRTGQIPHTGNLPEGLRELPVKPDGTPLRDDLVAPDHAGELITPDTRKAVRTAEKGKETTNNFLRRKFVIPGLIAVGALSIAGVTTAAVVGANQSQTVEEPAPGEEEPVVTPPENGGEEEPTEPTTPEAPVAPPVPERLEYGVTDADIAGYLGESQSAFLSRTPEDRATLIMYYAQGLPEFAEEYQAVSKSSKDELSGNIVNPENMTPEEILTFQNYLLRKTVTITNAADGNFAVDVNAADKAVAAQLINGNQSPYYNAWLTDIQEFAADGRAAPSARTLAVSNLAPVPTLNSASERFTDEAGRTCITLNVTNSGETIDATMCLVTNAHGSIWLAK